MSYKTIEIHELILSNLQYVNKMPRNILIISLLLFTSIKCIGQTYDLNLKDLIDTINMEKRLNKELLIRKKQFITDTVAEIKVKQDLVSNITALYERKSKISNELEGVNSKILKLNEQIILLNSQIEHLKSISARNASSKNQNKNLLSENIKLQLRVDSIRVEIKTSDDSLAKLKVNKVQLDKLQNDYNIKFSEHNLRDIELKRGEEVFKDKKDSLKLLVTIYNNYNNMKESNKSNIVAIEQRICQRINLIISSDNFNNSYQSSEISRYLDTISQLLKLKINSPTIKQCKVNAEQYNDFAAWSQQCNSALNSDFDQVKINELISKGQQVKSNTIAQNAAKKDYIILLSKYCKTYIKILEENKYMNRLSDKKMIKDEIEDLISSEFKDFPYIISELNKKLSNPKYHCQFNHYPSTCD